jgi:hypothetical protein
MSKSIGSAWLNEFIATLLTVTPDEGNPLTVMYQG